MFHPTILQIPDAELLVMQVIWDAPKMLLSKQIIQKVQKEINSNWKVSTIRTLISRLIARGCLAVEQSGKERYYTALIDEQTCLREITEKFLFLHYSGSFYQMFISLAGEQLRQLTTEELQRLKQILSKLDMK